MSYVYVFKVNINNLDGIINHIHDNITNENIQYIGNYRDDGYYKIALSIKNKSNIYIIKNKLLQYNNKILDI